MPYITATSKIDFEYTVGQGTAKEFAQNMFTETFGSIDKMIDVFDNANIKTRNFCIPVSFFEKDRDFEYKNSIYTEKALEKSIEAINECLKKSGIDKNALTDIIFVSTTGLATPSIDALIINKMRLNPNINRLPVWGLGCAGGVAGLAKANIIAANNPDSITALITVELCSLTFIRNDLSKSNFIATSLFSDGVAAVLVAGDNAYKKIKTKGKIQIVSAMSKLYYDALDVMGWEINNNGFKVLFSKDIPSIVSGNVKNDIEAFLASHNLKITDIKNFIFHPGGMKVLKAYEDALNLNGNTFDFSQEILNSYGNMSSSTVLYVLDKFLEDGFEDGYGLMLSLGPGFSSEMVLLSMQNNA
ncbi:MAG: type III polyketide synthase [Ignavibacteria bacterium]|jgi:alkylresorcinol/alkylpyrone synthase|nr:type III polyketide synthase [Ignavibacteria bacterium]